ncbi:hypothetical protein HYDPIDRAFT_29668 [Hydnomerulius pinastri MD-312]|uniref:Protein kinase domain-containing protein n=1 Tax=Hydnomerulius pinastri MD-312 TaxID=994086 RepID=A0A0C9VCV3_9AGAM|nr:hypothetical protein HYDPIDRAFT_29668 [Hydnomerulius pinastri MD-312]
MVNPPRAPHPAAASGGLLTYVRNVTQYLKGKGEYADDASGGFSDIWKCRLGKPGEPERFVAVKAFRTAGSDEKAMKKQGKKLRGEVHIWISIDHPNVLELYGIADGFAPLPSLVSPWAELGTLTKYLQGAGRSLGRGERISILVKVAKALDYIHSKPHHVVHGDLTGSNILIMADGEPKISDFGLSSIIEEFNGTSYFTSCKPGAYRWAAPELLGLSGDLPKPNVQSDVYSFGCIMIQVLSGQVPYGAIKDNFIFHKKLSGESPPRPDDLPIEAPHWELIQGCLKAAPGARPKMAEVIAFLNGQLESGR